MSRISPFISTLFTLISDPSNSELIAWDPCGLGFIIYNIAMFETNLMKQHFKNTSMSSFFRQLNLYSFKRTSDGRKFRGRGQNSWCRFYHMHFSPGNIHDLPLIKRQKPKSADHTYCPKIQTYLDPVPLQSDPSSSSMDPILNCFFPFHTVTSNFPPVLDYSIQPPLAMDFFDFNPFLFPAME
ncbi:Flocculation suppression protein [Entomophthora muscae]|uniref:Flocculation suppression protein n=1 Tax=Entomophthora muscae TaxID=34485 RepID=A0ACC2RRW9_9FUNG|nr:Flocculation suppression protein [Entomophthora muscae]